MKQMIFIDVEYKHITININKDNWDKFLIQSRKINLSASHRIDKFIEKQLRMGVEIRE